MWHSPTWNAADRHLSSSASPAAGNLDNSRISHNYIQLRGSDFVYLVVGGLAKMDLKIRAKTLVPQIMYTQVLL